MVYSHSNQHNGGGGDPFYGNTNDGHDAGYDGDSSDGRGGDKDGGGGVSYHVLSPSASAHTLDTVVALPMQP